MILVISITLWLGIGGGYFLYAHTKNEDFRVKDIAWLIFFSMAGLITVLMLMFIMNDDKILIRRRK